MHADWVMDDRSVFTSPVRVGYGEQNRLAGVQSTFTLDQVKLTRDHPGEEALCLVRARVPGSKTESVLVACSVLPCQGPLDRGLDCGTYPRAGASLAPQFSAVLQHHVGRIVEERRENKPVVWGGDFNQELLWSIKLAPLRTPRASGCFDATGQGSWPRRALMAHGEIASADDCGGAHLDSLHRRKRKGERGVRLVRPA